jgi:cytochrome c oxidase assembly factor CtaG
VDSTVDAFLASWRLDPWVVVSLLLAGGRYARGWLLLRRRGSRRFDGWRLAAFLGGLASLFVALASPLEPFAALLLVVHMMQHLLLMLVAPPLLWLGEPLLPLVRGLPGPLRRGWAVPLLGEPALRALGRRLTALPVAGGLFVGSTWLWHVPGLYELALRSPGWHRAEHACFFGTALLFWWPVVQPYPSRARGSRWALLPYLVLAGVQGTVLSAILTFSDRVLYPSYEAVPRLGGLSALGDQAAAGVLMWVPGSLVLLLPLVVLGARLLYGREGDAVFSLAAGTVLRRLRGLRPVGQPVAGRPLVEWGHRATAGGRGALLAHS